MSESWNFYLCRVDDHPASIYLNMVFIDNATFKDLPIMAYVRLYMKLPRQDGLSSQEEFETLCVIEDAIDMQFELSKTVAYVGRCTSDECRDFYFYISDITSWSSKVGCAWFYNKEFY